MAEYKAKGHLDAYDTEKLLEARKLVLEVYEYNYKSDSDPLTKKLTTILKKMDHLLGTDK